MGGPWLLFLGFPWISSRGLGSWCCLVSSLGFGDVFRFGACNLSVGFRAAVVIRLRLFSLGLLYDDSNDDEDEAGDDDEEDHEDSRFGLVGSKGVGFPKPRLQSSGGGGGVGGGGSKVLGEG